MPSEVIVELVKLLAPIVAAIGAVAAALISRRAVLKVRELHVEVNSRLTELLKSAKAEAGLAGEKRGRQAESQRADDARA